MFDYCMRVSCTVRNVGEGGGDVTVDLEILSPDGRPMYVQSLAGFMRPGDVQNFTYDFKQAKLLGSQSRGECPVLRVNPST